jgi:hypothetical protein
VEDYNRQRKRMRILGWATEEEVSSCSSTACSDNSESEHISDAEDNDPTRPLDLSSQRQEAEAEDKENGTREFLAVEGISIVVTTSRNGKTTTVIEAAQNANVGHGVEIVTKTVICGDEVTTVTTTSLLPLAKTS